MSGTKAGGAKAAATNKAKYGEGFYARIGKMGGQKGHTGGFAAMDPERVRECGRKGGRKSRRGPAKSTIEKLHEYGWCIRRDFNEGSSIGELSARYNISYLAIIRYLEKSGETVSKEENA